jgi:hypothetical protein
MATSAPLAIDCRLHDLFSTATLTGRGSPIYSVRPLAPCCGPYAGGSSDCARRFLHHWHGLHPFCKGSATTCPRTGLPSRGRSNDAATFTSCYGPEPGLPRSGRDVYGRACLRVGHPTHRSAMTTRAFVKPVTGFSPAGLTALWAAHKTDLNRGLMRFRLSDPPAKQVTFPLQHVRIVA